MLPRLLLFSLMTLLSWTNLQAQFPCVPGQIFVEPGYTTAFCDDGTPFVISFEAKPYGMPNAYVVVNEEDEILYISYNSTIDFSVFGGNVRVYSFTAIGSFTAQVGDNLYDTPLTSGCYELSENFIEINPNSDNEGGTLDGGPFEFCVGDGAADNIPANAITLTGNSGSLSSWVITDDQGNILGIPPSPEVVDFDGAPAGVCLVWHVSYEDGLSGLEMGMNIHDLQGCYGLSNSIAVNRNQPAGGEIGALTGNIAHRVAVANRASGTVSFINSETDAVLNTVNMPNDGEPMYVVHNSYNNTVLVGDYGGNVVAFDGADFSEVGSAAAGNGVFHMWLSPNNQQLWVNNELDRTISVINPNTLQNIATVALPQDLYDLGYKPHDVIVEPDNAYAFVSLLGNHDEDYVIKYSTTTFEEIGRIVVGLDPHVSLTANNDKLYVASQFSSELKVYNRSDLAEVATLNIPNAHGLGMNSAGTYLYVSNISNGGVEATYTVDLMTNTIIGEPVDAPFAVPHNYSVSSDDSKLYLTHSGPNSHVSVYDLNPLPTLSTSIAVENNPFGLVAYSYEETITELMICAGDGISDAFDVMAHGTTGGNTGWIITDADLNILALPAAPPFDLEGAPAGVCLIWQISFEDGLTGLEMGNNVADLMGCYGLSNAISVTRETNEGGVLEGGPFAFCVGDGVADHIEAGAITLSGNSGANSQWVITFPDGSIAGLPPSYEVVDFDGAGEGVCSVWHLSYADGLTGLEAGMQLSEIQGCYSLSNPIEVSRSQPEGGVLEGGPFAFCVGDGVADHIEAGAITLSGNSGANSQWVVTFPDGSIAGLPPSYEVVDFDGAGEGVCSVWHLSYADGLTGLEAGMQLSEIQGCYSLSNPIEVSRTQPEGGVLEGGPFAFCVGDGVADHIEAGAITLSGNSGANSQWVVTFPDGSIAGLPPSYEVVDFDGAGEGVCSVWHLSYADGLTGLEAGMQLSEIQGCYSLSNPIEVSRAQPEGGVLEGGPFAFCVGDGEADHIEAGAITLSGNTGANSQWVVTFPDGSIAGLPPSYEVVDFDGAGEGVCSVWHLSYADGLTGLEAGLQLSDIQGCYSLSNPIEVSRTQPEGGVLEGGPFAFCVGDGVADHIEAGAITLSGNSGANSQWVVTFPDGSIAGLPPSYEVVDFDGAGEGVCSVWHLSYADGLTGLEAGLQLSDIQGCYSLSNPIEVSRTQPEGGVLEGGPFAFCVGDGVADHIEAGAITLSGNSGANSQWVVTFPDGSIAGLPPSYEVVDFDGAGEGVCSIWHLSYADGLTGLEAGMQLSDIQGCYSLSNPIEVDRTQPEGGVLEGGPFEFEVGDGVADMIPEGAIELSGNSGSNSQWVVTFEDGSIAGLPPSYDVVDFDGAGEGTCSVYHLSYEDGIVGLEQGAQLSDLEGCFSLSNAISVVRSDTDGIIDNGAGTSFTSILDKALDVELYPNPVADLLQVALDVPSKVGDVELQITSLGGKVLYRAKIEADQSRVSIPVSTLFDGIYILTVVHEGEIVTKRFVKN